MKIGKAILLGLGCVAVTVLVSGCGTLDSVGSLANSIVNTAANTAVKAVSPSTYTGKSDETYNSREPLKRRRNTMSSREGSRSWASRSSHSASSNPDVGMPYKSRNFSER